jgi:hypothetical protein
MNVSRNDIRLDKLGISNSVKIPNYSKIRYFYRIIVEFGKKA